MINFKSCLSALFVCFLVPVSEAGMAMQSSCPPALLWLRS